MMYCQEAGVFDTADNGSLVCLTRSRSSAQEAFLVAPGAGSAAAASRPAATPFRSGPRLADGQRAAIDVSAVQGGYGRLGPLVGLHFHEAEALGSARPPVHDDLGQ